MNKNKSTNNLSLYKSTTGPLAYKNQLNEEVLVLKFDFKLEDTNEDGSLKEEGNFFLFEGYASTWAKDLGDDIIERGAFAESLRKRMPKVLGFHDADIVAGFTDEAIEDDIGLRVKGRIPKDGGNTPLIVPYMGVGGIDSLSIGFRISRDDKGEPMMDFINGVRIIKQVELFEYSFVTFPMNPAAKVGLKPEDEEGKNTTLELDFETIREAEKFFVEEFEVTGKSAKALISKIKSIANTRDDEANANNVDVKDTRDENTLTDDDYKDMFLALNPDKKELDLEGINFDECINPTPVQN